MRTVEITAKNFESTVQAKGTVVLDFWASWCGPCKAFAPVFEAMSIRYPDVTFGKVNTDEQQELAGALDIRSIPTVMLFRDGVLLFSQPGMMPAKALDELLQKALKLDMTKVLAEARQAAPA